jgi:hypothetical protein
MGVQRGRPDNLDEKHADWEFILYFPDPDEAVAAFTRIDRRAGYDPVLVDIESDVIRCSDEDDPDEVCWCLVVHAGSIDHVFEALETGDPLDYAWLQGECVGRRW